MARRRRAPWGTIWGNQANVDNGSLLGWGHYVGRPAPYGYRDPMEEDEGGGMGMGRGGRGGGMSYLPIRAMSMGGGDGGDELEMDIGSMSEEDIGLKRGGKAKKGRVHLVGEEGQELLVPRTDGGYQVIPNEATEPLLELLGEGERGNENPMRRRCGGGVVRRAMGGPMGISLGEYLAQGRAAYNNETPGRRALIGPPVPTWGEGGVIEENCGGGIVRRACGGKVKRHQGGGEIEENLRRLYGSGDKGLIDTESFAPVANVAREIFRPRDVGIPAERTSFPVVPFGNEMADAAMRNRGEEVAPRTTEPLSGNPMRRSAFSVMPNVGIAEAGGPSEIPNRGRETPVSTVSSTTPASGPPFQTEPLDRNMFPPVSQPATQTATPARPIHVIRGTEQTWANPADTQVEYGTEREAMKGKGTPVQSLTAEMPGNLLHSDKQRANWMLAMARIRGQQATAEERAGWEHKFLMQDIANQNAIARKDQEVEAKLNELAPVHDSEGRVTGFTNKRGEYTMTPEFREERTKEKHRPYIGKLNTRESLLNYFSSLPDNYTRSVVRGLLSEDQLAMLFSK